MTLDQIKKNAPVGATHKYNSKGAIWYFKNPKSWKIYYRHEWIDYSKLGFDFNMTEIVEL